MKLACVCSAMILASVVLPTPGGPQKISERRIVAFNLQPQRLSRAEQMLLPVELIERARPHAFGKRSALADGFFRA